MRRTASVTSIEIPSSVTSIGDQAFYGCSGLTSVIISNGVKRIGNYAFFLSGLTIVYYKGTAEEWNAISIGDDYGDLTRKPRYYYSESEPALTEDGTAYDGNYWHYDTDGITPVSWTKEN